MIHEEYFDDFGIHYYCARDPYDLDEHYVMIERAIKEGVAQGHSWTMTFIDMAEVNLLEQSEATFRRFISRRQILGVESAPRHLVVLVGDRGSFGMMRMYGMLAELGGLRDEENYFVAMKMSDIAEWMASRLARGTCAELLARLEQAGMQARAAFRGRNPEGSA